MCWFCPEILGGMMRLKCSENQIIILANSTDSDASEVVSFDLFQNKVQWAPDYAGSNAYITFRSREFHHPTVPGKVATQRQTAANVNNIC